MRPVGNCQVMFRWHGKMCSTSLLIRYFTYLRRVNVSERLYENEVAPLNEVKSWPPKSRIVCVSTLEFPKRSGTNGSTKGNSFLLKLPTPGYLSWQSTGLLSRRSRAHTAHWTKNQALEITGRIMPAVFPNSASGLN